MSSPDAKPRLVLLVGSPRSGTSWLQGLLGAHPEIASPQETDIFRSYLQPMVELWDLQLSGATDTSSKKRRKGLPLVLDEPEFFRAGGALVDAVIDATHEMKPGARVVLEKTPAHSLAIDVARRFVPDLPVIHLIRDGRDVASSLLAASQDWGELWAPDSVASAARVWDKYVRAARRAGPRGPYLELRYETLRGPDGWQELQRAFAFCGAEVTEAEAKEALDQQSFERMAERHELSPGILVGGAGAGEAARQEPEGFFRRGSVGSWRDEWTLRQRQAFAEEADALLRDLGYESDDRWIAGPARPPLFVRAGHRAANRGAARLRRLADRIERLPHAVRGQRARPRKRR